MVAQVESGTPGPSVRDQIDDMVDQLVPDVVRPFIVPVLMGAVLVVGVALTVARVDLLLGWSERFDGTGRHVVTACESEDVRGGNRWACDGALVVDGSPTDVRSTLVVSRGAAVSRQPFVGEPNEVFFDPDQLGRVHPVVYRLNELARLYLSVLPRVLLAGGAGLWLAGWALTRHLDATDLLLRDRVRLPGRFSWKTRGRQWLVVAGLALVVNHLLTTQLIGSLGTF